MHREQGWSGDLQELAGTLTASDTTALSGELEHLIKTYVGVSTRVEVLAGTGIERTNTGKARRVLDQRASAAA